MTEREWPESADQRAAAGLAERLERVEQRIRRACQAAGRDRSTVALLPVSKTQPVAAIRQARAAGLSRMGENRVQELVAKAERLGDLPDLAWVLIGHLQSNKVALAARWASQIQSVDSLRLAQALDRQGQSLGRPVEVLIEVNTSGEPSKFGFPPDQVPAAAAQLRHLTSLRPLGLMTVAQQSSEPDQVAACFARLAALRERLRQDQGGGWAELSMGMSGDFDLAIAQGSTCLRIGSAIFGPRPVAAADQPSTA
ncbi:MAG: YggS family pyridoxal phosphate-dependent enzyme [Propionibacteriaceae bacterium]|jgi:pyridoxal phosphate enzyme (YggS family)|nr:YggS family pyridoxal phosphate-dependent enzyme [Propionibacteriaceae bacterium]